MIIGTTDNQERNTEDHRENETNITWRCVLEITVKINISINK